MVELTKYRSSLRTSRVVTFALHFVGVCILFALPELILSIDRGHRHEVNSLIYIKPLLMVVVFYVNFYLIFPITYGGRHKWLHAMLLNLILIVGVLWVQNLILPHGAGRTPFNPHHLGVMSEQGPGGMLSPMQMQEIVMYVMAAVLSYAIRLALRHEEAQQERSELMIRQRSEELTKLKAQLRPHFLFNALNTVYALIDIDAPMAKDAVERISSMLRYVLYETSSMVSLRSEMEFIGHYVSLMRLRMSPSERLDVTLDCGRYADSRIAPLLFINLAENVFKHGRTGASRMPLMISITVDDDGTVVCRTENDVARAASSSKSSSIGGKGLSNLRRRIDLLYGTDASLITDIIDNRFIAELKIKLT